MVKEKVERFYDRFSEQYNKTHLSRFVDKVFEYFLFNYLPKNRNLKILDAGGGIGRFSFPLVKKGYSVVLTDISIGMLNKAKEIASNSRLKNIEFFKESVTNMRNQRGESFDVVLLMNGVLDYCKNYRKALKDVHRVLKNNGIAIGSVNNRFIYTTINVLLEEGDVTRFKRSFRTGNRFKKFPIHDFTLEELKKELAKAKFKIIDILGPTNLLRKWEYNKLVTYNNEKDMLILQIDFAKRREYVNNSTDFLFIAKK